MRDVCYPNTMAEDLTITLPEPLASDLRAAAAKRGISPDALVREELEAALADHDALEWPHEDTSVDDAAFAEFERNGVAVRGEDVVTWLKSLSTETPLPEPIPHKIV
jgi:plasmid stability protein